jgi:hypothetical protein
MDDATLKEFEKQYRDLPDARVEAEIERWLPNTAPRRVLLGILAERRSAAQEAEQQRFRESYDQMERHHRDYKRVSLIAAAVSVIAALAAWASVWYSSVQTRIALDAFHSQQSPSPSPSIAPASQRSPGASITPSPTAEASSSPEPQP